MTIVVKTFRKSGGAALAGALLLGGAGHAQAPSGVADVHRLSEHIRILASDAFEGRGPDTPGEVKAVDYITGQFKALGLEPGGENGGWLQAVRLNRFQTQAPTVLAFTLNGQSRPLSFGADAVVQSRRPGLTHVDVKNAPLVFVGYGVNAPEQHWDDFKNSDVWPAWKPGAEFKPASDATAAARVASR
ncbi:MAG: hypothetical protein INR64_18080 [Caulobacteraceae bacterium]|nr:hypothetical protein [Caulobacter sp.]